MTTRKLTRRECPGSGSRKPELERFFSMRLDQHPPAPRGQHRSADSLQHPGDQRPLILRARRHSAETGEAGGRGLAVVVGDKGVDALTIDRRRNMDSIEGSQRRLDERSGGRQ